MRRASVLLAVGTLVATMVGAVFAHAATDVGASVGITNVTPTVDAIRISSAAYSSDSYPAGVTLLPNATNTVYLTGTLTDRNGDGTIATTSAVFYRSGLASSTSCTTDNNNCYRVATCSLDTSYGSATEAAYACPVGLMFWADATDAGGRYPGETWIAAITASDIHGSSTVATTSREVLSLLSLSVPSTLSYTTLALGATTTAANNSSLTFTQQGNTRADVQVSGTAMTCSGAGSIPVSAQRWSLTDVGYSHASTTALSATATTTYMGVDYRDSESISPTASLYFNIGIPTSTVSGTCSGTNVVAVVVASGDEAMFLDAAVEGIAYTSPSYSGYTDAAGMFRFRRGETTTFSIGKLVLGTIEGNAIPMDKLMFLQDLVGTSRTDTGHAIVKKTAQFLQTLDSDGNANNGITITQDVRDTFTTSQDINSLSVSDLTSLTKSVYPKRGFVNENQAVNHLKKVLREHGVSVQ